VLSAAAAAQDEHQRRLAAELAVMAGDVRRLAGGSGPAQQREGLQARLAGALSSLPLLMRRAGADPVPVAALRSALARNDLDAVMTGLSALRRSHPLDLRGVLPAPPTAERLRLGEVIHRQSCAGCHDVPVADSKLPALDLFQQAGAMSREEFAARLLAGVRGDRTTAYRNPFSDLEIGALLAYYESVRGADLPAALMRIPEAGGHRPRPAKAVDAARNKDRGAPSRVPPGESEPRSSGLCDGS
jgi:mono/diheme cytochrome c family protein